MNRLGEGGKIAIHFLVDISGLVEVDRADYVVEVNETIPSTQSNIPYNTHLHRTGLV